MAASVLMIWRLEAMSASGFEGTVLGTLVMPYCSGIGNLIFAGLLARQGGPGAEVMTNCLVNNVTNMTLVLGVPALIWGLRVVPAAPKPESGQAGGKGKARRRAKPSDGGSEHKVNRLSLLLTLSAVLFFTGAVWALGRDGSLNHTDGLVLVGLFFFWQTFHLFDVLKGNVRANKKFNWMLPVDLLLLGIGAYAVYKSIDWLVAWLPKQHHGILRADYLGWLSGWLMVLPNALLALYYGWRGQPEVTYASQVGDGHICIPLCVGVYALHRNLVLPASFQWGAIVLLAATAIHFLFVAVLGRLPRWAGLGLIVAYCWFLNRGLPH